MILLGSLFLMLPIATKDGQITPFSSITSYSTQPIVNMTIMVLIIVGGIGFLTWEDIKNNKWNFKKYRMQSKVILSVTALLIVLPTLYFFFFEFSHLPVVERIWVSLFQAVTPRTAGFNSVDLTLISEVGQMLIFSAEGFLIILLKMQLLSF